MQQKQQQKQLLSIKLLPTNVKRKLRNYFRCCLASEIFFFGMQKIDIKNIFLFSFFIRKTLVSNKKQTKNK